MKSKKITESAKQQISDVDRCCDKNTFAICGKNFIKIYNLTDKDSFDLQTTRRVQNPTNIRFHPRESEILVSVHTNPSNILIMNIKKGINEQKKIGKHERQITGISWNNHKTDLLATCSIDQTIKFWNINNQKDKNANLAPDPLFVIENKEHLRDCQFSPFDENLLLCCGDGGSVFLYDIRKYDKDVLSYNSEIKNYSFQQMQEKVQSVCWHPTKRNIFCTGGMDQFIHIWDIWDVNSFNPKRSLKASDGVTKVKFMRNNPDLIIVSLYQLNNFYTSIWNVNNKYMPEYIYSGHKDMIISFACDSNEKRLLTLCKDGNVNIYNLKSDIKVPNYDSGKRVLDYITTNVIKFAENNELYCYHEKPMEKTSFNNIEFNNFNGSNNSNNYILDKHSSEENSNFESSNNLNIFLDEDNSSKDKNDLNENDKKIYLLNFNQKEMQSMYKDKDKTIKETKVYISNNTLLTLDSKLQQFYFYTTKQIKDIFTEYKVILDIPEGALKFGTIQYSNLKTSEKIKSMVEYNLEKAASYKINNYNHISIWNQLLFLVKQESFQKIINKLYNTIDNDINNISGKQNRRKQNKKLTSTNIGKDDLKFYCELTKKHVLDIIEYLIEVHGDVYLATVIGYMFRKLIETDKKGQKRLIRLQTDCYNLLIKLKLFREANYLKKYGQNHFEKINEKSDSGNDNLENFKYCFSCDCGAKYCPSLRKNENGQYEKYLEFGKCKCGKAILCEICKKPTLGLFVWCPGCGHGGHLSHMTKLLDSNGTCPGCGHRCK